MQKLWGLFCFYICKTTYFKLLQFISSNAGEQVILYFVFFNNIWAAVFHHMDVMLSPLSESVLS